MEKTKTIGRVMAALEQGLLWPASAVAAACDPAATRWFLELLRAPKGQVYRVPGFACRPRPAGQDPPRRRRRLASKRVDPGRLV